MANREINQLKGLRIQIDYGNFVFENHYPEHNTLVWKSIKGSSITGMPEGFEVQEKVTVMMPATNQFLISWVEASGLGVTQFLDLQTKKIHSVIRNGQQLIAESGDITIISTSDEA